MPEVTESTPAPQSQAGKCQKDESSVNREIATLLLNLASRTQSGQQTTGPQLHRETETEAMDLSKVKGDVATYLLFKKTDDLTPDIPVLPLPRALQLQQQLQPGGSELLQEPGGLSRPGTSGHRPQPLQSSQPRPQQPRVLLPPAEPPHRTNSGTFIHFQLFVMKYCLRVVAAGGNCNCNCNCITT